MSDPPEKAPSKDPPLDPPRRWRPGWNRQGETVIFAGRRYLCLRDTAGQPSDRPRAAHIWRPLD